MNTNKTLSLVSPKTNPFLRFSSLLAAPAALFFGTGQAKAALSYNIYESGGNVVIETSGTLDLTGALQVGTDACGADGGIAPSKGLICTGPNVFVPLYSMTGPTQLNPSTNVVIASNTSGSTLLL